MKAFVPFRIIDPTPEVVCIGYQNIDTCFQCTLSIRKNRTMSKLPNSDHPSSLKVELPAVESTLSSRVPTGPKHPPCTPITGVQQLESFTNERKRKIQAALIIEKAWIRYRDKQMFKLLKHALCAAEHSLSYDILRKVASREASFLKDKCFQCRVRFRFGGSEYPPMIFFKVYLKNMMGVPGGLQYLNGKKAIKPASEAARDACDRMGNRKFLEQVTQDVLLHRQHQVTDEVDVTSLKDYMQYSSLLDETPASMGGRDNSWRKLTLDVLPRQTIFYDVVDYLYNSSVTERLKDVMPILFTQPTSSEAFLQHISIISNIRPASPPAVARSPNPMAAPQTSARRSRQARSRATRMRKTYSNKQDGNADLNEMQMDDGFLDTEADQLYEWTQELSFEDIAATPRLPAHASMMT